MDDSEDQDRSFALGGGRKRRRRKRAPGVPGAMLEQLLLATLAPSEVPLSAYELTSSLRDRGHGVPVMSIYRALDRLIERDLIQKVETLSAYRIRDKPGAVLLICIQCGKTTSVAVPAEYGNIAHALPAVDFAVSNLAIEATGRCAACRAAPDDSDLPSPSRSSPADQCR